MPLLVGRLLLAVLSVVSLGFLAWVAPLVGAVKDRDRTRRLCFWLAVPVAAACDIGGGALLTSVPDAEEDLVVRDDVGFLLVLVAITIGMVSAFLFRPGREEQYEHVEDLPGVEEALARREKRLRFQELAAKDPVLARELGVGRPDRPGGTDDGGLVDLNALDAEALQRHAGLTGPQARTVVEVRSRLGHLHGVEDVVVHGSLDPGTAERLRTIAVFLPPGP